MLLVLSRGELTAIACRPIGLTAYTVQGMVEGERERGACTYIGYQGLYILMREEYGRKSNGKEERAREGERGRYDTTVLEQPHRMYGGGGEGKVRHNSSKKGALIEHNSTKSNHTVCMVEGEREGENVRRTSGIIHMREE